MKTAKVAVLNEQKKQRRQRVSDQEMIADIYFMHNEQCQIDANMIAMRDQKEARMILSQENGERCLTRSRRCHVDKIGRRNR